MRVAVVGCGVVGGWLVRRLLELGHHVRVHDRHRESTHLLERAGAVWAADLDELADGRELVLTALPGPTEVDSIASALIERLAPGALLVETSTIDATLVRRLHRDASERGIALLDAGVSLGETVGGNQQLTIWYGGEARAYQRWRRQLEPLGRPTLYCGPIGAGKIVKLVHNAVAHGLVVLLCEALATGTRAGVPIEVLCGALGAGTAQTRMLDEILARSLFRGDFRPGLKLSLAVKDLELAASLADRVAIPIPMVLAALQAYKVADAAGLGDESLQSVAKQYEQLAGGTFRLGRYKSGDHVD